MDIETYTLVKGKVRKADEAAKAAEKAASNANDAVDAIYHDKNFLLSVKADKSLTLSYNPETEE